MLSQANMIFASNNYSFDTQTELISSIDEGTEVKIIGETGIAPRVDVLSGTTVNSGTDSSWPSLKFTIPSKASYFNVNFKNTSSGTVTVNVFDSNGNNIKNYEVSANDEKSVKLTTTGSHSIRIDKSGGYITGTLRVAYY